MELIVRKRTLNRRRHLYVGKVKVYEVSIEVMLITSLILLALFLGVVFMKQHHQKGLKSHKQLITHINSKISCRFEDTC